MPPKNHKAISVNVCTYRLLSLLRDELGEPSLQLLILKMAIYYTKYKLKDEEYTKRFQRCLAFIEAQREKFAVILEVLRKGREAKKV